jgi:putative PIG3 family NAD(P)H quinone oxidoreductase
VYAITIAEPGGPEVLTWAEVPDPEPGPDEVVIDIAASAVNRADLLQRQGLYDPPKGASPYLGLECSGTVSATGAEVETWQPGDRVCALLSGGGYAERVAVPHGQLLPIPSTVDLTDAAALPEVACTVWSNIGGLQPHQTILVHGGASGIGTFAIQFAKALGATVLTTARASKHEALKALGADVTIDYETEDFTAHRADLILDIMGAAYLARNLQAINQDGRLVIIGLQGGRAAELDIAAVMAKRATVTGSALRPRSVEEKADIVKGVRENVWPLIESRKIRPIIHSRVPLRNAAEAHRIVEASEHIGKVLLKTAAAPAPD